MVFVKFFSKHGCKFCDLAEAELICANIKYNIVKNADSKTINELKEKYNHTTYPFVFVNNEFIGGYNELHKIILEQEEDF